MRIWWVVALAACGRVNFDPRADAPIAVGDATPDGVDDSHCQWTDVHELAGLRSDFEDAEPALSPDGSLIVYTSTRLGGDIQRLFASAPVGDSWSAPMLVTALDSNTGDHGPAWNATGDRLYFSSFRGGPLRLYVASYSPATGFGPPSLVPGLELLGESRSPTLRGDELEMYFSTRLSPNRIERAVRPSIGDVWTSLGAVPELDGPERGFPGISSDGLTLYIEEGTFPDIEITRSIRASIDDPWPPPEPVGSLAGLNGSGDPQPTLDGERIVFSTDRTSPNDYDIWAATRVCGQ